MEKTIKQNDVKKTPTKNIEDFFRKPIPKNISVTVDQKTYDLLTEREKQLKDIYKDNSELEISFDKVVELSVLNGLEGDGSFQQYLARNKTNSGLANKKQKVNKTSQNSEDLTHLLDE